MLISFLQYVPSVQSFAETIMQRIGIAFVDTERFGPNTEIGHPTPVMITPPATLTVREFQERITFSVLTPTQLPEDLPYVYRGLQSNQSGQTVEIQYCRTMDMSVQKGCLFLFANYNAQPPSPLLAESKEQMVEVNGQPGIYVHGGWQDNGQGDPNTRLGNLLWDDKVDAAYLTWEQDGVIYLFEGRNLELNLDDLLRVAASMERN